MTRLLFSTLLILSFFGLKAENGYDLWLRYQPLDNEAYVSKCKTLLNESYFESNSETATIIKNELKRGLNGLLKSEINIDEDFKNQDLLIGTFSSLKQLGVSSNYESSLNKEGYSIQSKKNSIVLVAKTEIGLLYGTFHLLRLVQTESDLTQLNIIENPKTTHRLLNHWDNLDRTVERGYAGFSIWDWHKLPDFIDQRYIDYARANASIGINGTVVSNVNSNALVLTPQYLNKLNGLATAFRPYGLKVYLTARFSAPIEIGGLKTADPLDKEVQKWWKNKAQEIYSIIPDFGGFLVKANSEGQPGPQDYNRTHAEGANLLAKAVAPFGGIVMWRAFVYSHEVPDDRAKQAYSEFMPLDEEFDDNVFIQVKNGAIDFQPREPFHPLFGAMTKTPLMMEFQITQEYLGCATHLVYLAPMYKETLKSDTYAKGEGSTVAASIDGTLYNQKFTGMAGVSNIGNDINWTGHPFAQANWYALGRLAWNHNLSSEQIAEEWLRMTFSNEDKFIETVKPIMLNSRETAVNYMTPLGLHHQMAAGHHWGPGPWVDNMRPDWTSVYYHRADEYGIGFDRSSTGSKATHQYFPEVKTKFDRIESCPEQFLLWFHHVSWDYKMKSGQTLWNEMVDKYYQGALAVKEMKSDWQKVEQFVDQERFNHVNQLLDIQIKEAEWWKNACLLYYQQFSKQAIPEKYEQPEKGLDYYKNQKYYYVPGIKNEF